MHHPKLVIFDSDPRLATALKTQAASRRWLFRRTHRRQTCLDCLSNAKPALLIVRGGQQSDDQCELLDFVRQRYPWTFTVVALDHADAALVASLWDLGAGLVIIPPWSPLELGAIVGPIMERLAREWAPSKKPGLAETGGP